MGKSYQPRNVCLTFEYTFCLGVFANFDRVTEITYGSFKGQSLDKMECYLLGASYLKFPIKSHLW